MVQLEIRILVLDLFPVLMKIDIFLFQELLCFYFLTLQAHAIDAANPSLFEPQRQRHSLHGNIRFFFSEARKGVRGFSLNRPVRVFPSL